MEIIPNNILIHYIMTITNEFKNFEKFQQRCIKLSSYLEKNYPSRYDDLIIKLGSLVGVIDEVLNFDEK